MDQASKKREPAAHVAVACDLLKALRAARLSNRQICEETGMHHNTIRRWLDELVVHGFVVKTPGNPNGKVGKTPNVYTLAREWGGQL